MGEELALERDELLLLILAQASPDLVDDLVHRVDDPLPRPRTIRRQVDLVQEGGPGVDAGPADLVPGERHAVRFGLDPAQFQDVFESQPAALPRQAPDDVAHDVAQDVRLLAAAHGGEAATAGDELDRPAVAAPPK